jgi:hypothetical protein
MNFELAMDPPSSQTTKRSMDWWKQRLLRGVEGLREDWRERSQDLQESLEEALRLRKEDQVAA